MPKRWSLRFLLALLVLAVAGPLGGQLGYSAYASIQANAAAARASALTLAQLSAANVRDLLADAGAALARLGDRPLVRALDPAQCDPLLEEYPVLDPRFVDVVLADPAGRVVCSAIPRPAGSALADPDWVGRALGERAFVVSDLFKDPVTGRWVAMLAYRVAGQDGQVGGLGLALDLARFEAAWQGLTLPPGAVISIVNEHGMIVARSLDPEQWVGRVAIGAEIVDRVLDQTEGQVQARGVDGQDRLYGFTRVEGSAWHVYAGVPTELALAETNAIAVRSLGLGLLSALLVAGLTITVSRRIEQPARQLAQAARAIAQTGALTRAPVAGPAELAEVAEQFNAMLDARRHAEARLQRTHRALTLLSAVNQTLVHTDDEQRLLDETCRLAVVVGGYLMAWVGYAEDDDSRSVRPVAAQGIEAKALEASRISWAEDERGHGTAGTAIRTGAPCLVRNIQSDPVYAPWRAALVRRGYAASIAFPLRVEGRVLGAVSLYVAEPEAFDEDEVHLLTELADDLAFGLGALQRRAERDRAVAALRASEERLARVVEAVPDGITIVDAAGQITFANAAAERILGLTRSVLTERQYDDPAWRITAVDGGPFPPEALPFAQVLATGTAVVGVEHAIEHPDGRRVVLSINAAPLREAGGGLSGMVAAISDITERKQAEAERERLLAREQAAHAEAKAGRARLANVLERMGDAFVALDRDWRYTYMNQKAGQIFNRQPEAMLGKHIWTEFPEGIRQPFYHAYYRAVETQASVTLEEYYPPYERWFENRIYPSADGLAIFFQDITERKRAEAALAKAHRQTEEALALLQSVLDNAPIGLAFVDRDFRFVRLNAALADINGASVEAHLGRTVAEVLPELWPGLEPLYQRVLTSGQAVTDVEVSGETPAVPGQLRHWLANYYPVRLGEGQIQGVGIAILEITERKRAAEAVERERDFTNAALDSLPGMVYLYDQTGKFLRWNRNFEVVSGYSAAEIARMTPLDYFVGAEKEHLARRIQEVFEKGESDAEAPFTAKNGVQTPYYFTGKRVEIGGVACLIGMGVDITARRRAEAALRRSEQVLRLFVEHSPAAIAMLDKEMRYSVASRRYLADYDLGDQDLTGRSHYDVFPEIPERWQAIHRRCLAGATEKADEDPFPRADGRLDWVRWEIRPWYEADGEIGGLILFSEVITERKQAEETVRYQASLLENISDAVISTGPDFVIRSWNKAAETVYGWLAAQVIGRPVGEILPTTYLQDDPAQVLAQFQVNGSWKGEVVQRRKDGTPLAILSSVTLIRDTAGRPNGAVAVNRDITDRKQAEAAWHESEERYRNLLEVAPVGIAVHSEGKVVFTNPAGARLLGATSPEQLIGKSILEIIHPDGLTAAQARIQRMLAGEPGLYPAEDTYVRLDGTPVDVEVMATPLKYQGQLAVQVIVADISERKRAEVALRQSEEKFSKAFRSSPAALLITRLADGLFLEVNDTYCAIVGFERAELVGRRTTEFNIFVHASDRQAIVQQLLAHKSVRDFETSIRHKAGEIRHVIASQELITFDGQECILSSMVDVTERKRADEALRQLNTELEQRVAERTAELKVQYQRQATLEERQRLARDLHDVVSQTLFSASVIAETLPRLWERNPVQVRQGLDELHRLTRGALAEMRALLLELRPEALAQTNLADLLQQLASALAGRTELELIVSAEPAPTLPGEVRLGLYRMAQEALNNVVKHARARRVEISLAALGDGVSLAIRDDGQGFDPAAVASGRLGLSILGERAEAIGATLAVTSAPGAGTEISVTWLGEI